MGRRRSSTNIGTTSAGAVVPVADMAAPGRLLSLGLVNRYSFEALGRSLHLDQTAGPSGYGGSFAGAVGHRWLLLAGFAVLCALATMWVLRRQCRVGAWQR